MEDFKVINNETVCDGKFFFWSKNERENFSSYSLYMLTKYGYDRCDFTPVLETETVEEMEKIKSFLNDSGYFYSVIGKKKISIYDNSVKEFDEITAPVYIYTAEREFVLTDEMHTQKFPTERMLDKAYKYYNEVLTFIRLRVLDELITANVNSGEGSFKAILNFNPTYYIGKNEFLIKSEKLLDGRFEYEFTARNTRVLEMYKQCA